MHSNSLHRKQDVLFGGPSEIYVYSCLRSANRGDRGPRVPPLNPPLYGSGDDYVGDDINVFAVPLKLVSRRRECQAV